jgi:cardiolipin synthase
MPAPLDELWERLGGLWPAVVTAVNLAVAAAASGHAVLHKRDTRAAIAWVGFIWLVPLFGALLYALLGVNRIARRARSLRGEQPPVEALASEAGHAVADLSQALGEGSAHLAPLARLVAVVTGRPLVGGNRVCPLSNGDEAYPAMLRAISEARDSVLLSTYIFDNDRAGRLFLAALGRAAARGVEARVLLDDVGARYSVPSVAGALRQAGVRVARFLPTLLPSAFPYANLRNHRKLLVVDGRVGFTGGMNIREGCWLEMRPRRPVRDLHFQVEGPVVAHLQRALVEDWAFCTGEALRGERWFPPLPAAGDVLARGICAGPDDDFEKLRLTLLGALSCARSSVLVVTPYFLPDPALITALNVAALRGVAVDVVLPEENNLTLVRWASTALLWQVLERGCRVWLTPPPFDHTKLLVVDGAWALAGSSNWDPRSLRLNFEFDLECHSPALAAALTELALARLRLARPVSLTDLDGRSLPARLRDGLARLLSPYL